MKKEEWIDEILQSAKQINPVESNPYITTRIEARLQDGTGTINQASLRWTYSAVAILIMIVAINIAIWNQSSQSSDKTAIRQLVQDYGWNNNAFYSSHFSK